MLRQLILLAAGTMDLTVMALLTVAISAERLAPWPRTVARTAGVVTLLIGALRIARALGVAPSVPYPRSCS